MTNLEHFVKKLKLDLSDYERKVKVVAVFGNTGDGKSHTMNNIFFDGYEVNIFNISTLF